ncbi:AAA family ATPase [Planomonospora sp. ID82291]|uniref:nSTAND1 domain-containing NTPase n=1 Tax=Planomonospora sp. ID82291 TaxID=2738136 RepID=UPI0018C3C782|nr:AAA family ATPase [Planomonospora sp. ID82291]MBG0814848.1 AAA family ATPase [Planomonospora sp. ID82291]
MSRHRWLTLFLQVLLVVVAALLGIVTNYATDADQGAFPLRVLQQIAAPSIGVLILVLISVTIVTHRLENPPSPKRKWDSSRPPYPGLDAFREDEASIFFGRDRQINDLVRRLHDPSAAASDRFVALVGASGSGKSSLAQAGVVPRLRERRWVIPPVMTPGSNPMAALADALSGTTGATDAHALLRRLRQSPDALARHLQRFRSTTGNRFSRLLLVVDQFEELLTTVGEHERELFLSAIRTALDRDRRLWILATLRIEFLRDFLETTQTELFENPAAIGAISRLELAQAVEEPGRLAGMGFAPGLVDLVVQEAGTSDALPLLAYLLQELYDSVGSGRTATITHYRSLGGVGGAMARQADQVVVEFHGEIGIGAVLSVLLKFVTVEGQEATRRKVVLSELNPDERRIVDAFVEARLLVTDVRDDQPIGQVAHEAMFRQWPPLRQEIEARVEQLRQRAELERWAVDWQRSGRSDDYLLTGSRLALAQQWTAGLAEAGQITEGVRELVDVSQRRDLAFLRRISDGIGRHVLVSAERSPETSLLLSLAALDECVMTPAALRGLMTALTFSHSTVALDGHTDTVRNLAWSPDGTRVVTASRDGTGRVWDAVTGRTSAVLSGHEGMVEMASWSPDSSMVATASRDQTIRLWDAGTGDVRRVLTGARDVVRGVDWAPDGRHVAGASRDLVVRIWDAASGETVRELRGHRDNVIGIAWSPDGHRLATASHDRTVIIWNVAENRADLTLEGHQDYVEGIAWSPDGTRVATSSGDQTIRIWDAGDGRQTLLIRGHREPVWNVDWSPDGRMLVSASADGTARIWDPYDARPLGVLRGHGDGVWGAAWSPDGSRIATACADGSARVWDPQQRGAETMLFAGHGGTVHDAAWSPDGARAATCSEDGTVRLWDAGSGRLQHVFDGHDDLVRQVRWSPDGATLASCSSDRSVQIWRADAHSATTWLDPGGSIVECLAWSHDGTRLVTGGHDRVLRVWDAADGRQLTTLTGHQDWIIHLAWSPDQRMLASTSDDRTARIWNIAAGEQHTVLRGHEGWVDCVSWSADGTSVVTGSADRTARIWDVASGRQTGVLQGHEGRVHAVAWSPDGTRIATGSDDRTVRVWDPASREEIAIAGVHCGRITSVAWSADGRSLLTASSDGTARIWQAEPDLARLQALARSRVYRNLTEEERRSHMLPLRDRQ